MNLLLRTIVDLFNAIAAWYYQHKYGAAARQLGRLPEEEDGRRGFIIVEIDGLAHEYLRLAMKQGYMPYLARLVQGSNLRLARWRCGLPSTTPASQAGIMFGNNWDIPGFRWYDKEKREGVMCKLPGTVRAIQERISMGRSGLLRGGSSYTNMFDGDARLALFTLSAVGRDHLFENVRGLGFLILFGLSLARVLRVIGLSIWTWLVYVVSRSRSWVVRNFAPGPWQRERHFTFLGPVLEIFNNIIFREVTTFSVMVDIYRGMPSIYAAYTGYDEIAHHFGADSKKAFRALRGLDKQIRQIDRFRQLYVQREYDLLILSDHGMTPSVPFRWAYGHTLEDLIADHTGFEVYDAEKIRAGESLTEARIHFVLGEIRSLEARPHRPMAAQLLRQARLRLEDRLLIEELAFEWDLSMRGDIAVRNSGPLSHIYFNVTRRAMDLSEVTLLHPRLLEALAEHEGIGLVVGREDDEVMIVGNAGTLWVGPQRTRLEGENPLNIFSDPDWAAGQVARVAQFPHAGDLILLGAWDGEKVITFEEQVATHGGLGGAQGWPFLAVSSEERLSVRGVKNSEEIYTLLAKAYGDYG